jgi:hypothetical protein
VTELCKDAMPNSGDRHYQGDEIRRKLELVCGNQHLSPVERKHVEDVIYDHLPAILGEKTHIASCPVCQAPLAGDGKCPNRNKEGHTIKRNSQDRSLPSG